MQSIKNMINTTSDFKVLETYQCQQCGLPRRVLKANIRGEEKLIDRCINCEDIEHAKIALENKKKNLASKMQNYFDSESLINESLKTACFENYNPKTKSQHEAKQTAMQYVQEFNGPKNIIFSGTYGVGKSHLSVAITKKLMEKGKACVFISVPRLFTKIKSTFGKRDITEDDIIKALAQADCLVLDDIGAEHIQLDNTGQGHGWGVSKLFEIIDSRSGKHTIFTTNLSSSEMRNRFGQRNFSRLMQNTIALKVEGDDYRLKGFKG